MILSAALMLRHGLGREDEAAALESAVDRALAGGLRTADLGGGATTAEATEAVLEELDVNQADLIWMNGELVAWEDAKVHVLTHALHYGTGVFEGVRAYETPRGTAIFRHAEHIDRLFASAGHVLHGHPVLARRRSGPPRTRRSCATGCKSCYIRPLVFRGAGPMGLYPLDCPVDVVIAVWEWGAYLGDEGKQRGVRGKVSSWRRIPSDAVIPQAKATGQYLNSVLAKLEADKAGYEEAILLDDRGMVCEGSGENLFVIRDGVIATPGSASDILGGISRTSAIQIARDLGYEVVERDIARGELYLADEVFMTGTAAELTPLREIDDRPVGDGEPGPITRDVQREFEDALHGRSERYADWLDVVGRPRRPRRERRPRLRLHPARRHAGRGHVALRGGEAAGRARARRPRRADDRGRLPGLEPQGGRALRAARRRVVLHRRDRRVRHDAPARRARPTRTRRCACWPTPSRPSARSSARPGACTSRRSCASAATRTCA